MSQRDLNRVGCTIFYGESTLDVLRQAARWLEEDDSTSVPALTIEVGEPGHTPRDEFERLSVYYE